MSKETDLDTPVFKSSAAVELNAGILYIHVEVAVARADAAIAFHDPAFRVVQGR